MSRQATAVVLGLALTALGCSEVTGTVRLDYAGVQRPVSGSAHYITPQGEFRSPGSYQPVQHVKFQRTFSAELGEETEDRYDLGAEFNPVAQSLQADAFVNVTSAMTDDNFGSNTSRAIWRGLGWSFVGMGALFAGLGYGMGLDDMGTAGLVIGGAGGLCVVFGEVANDPAKMTVVVEGDAVRSLGGPLMLPQAPPPPAPMGTPGAPGFVPGTPVAPQGYVPQAPPPAGYPQSQPYVPVGPAPVGPAPVAPAPVASPPAAR